MQISIKIQVLKSQFWIFGFRANLTKPHWKTMKTNQKLRKTMKLLWKTMKQPWKPTKNHEQPWDYLERPWNYLENHETTLKNQQPSEPVKNYLANFLRKGLGGGDPQFQ